jgi:hypothetical protein
MRLAPPLRRAAREVRGAGRASPANRRTAGATRLERLAAFAASRVVRGERGVRALGHAPVARAPDAASLGAPLPPDLLQRLELGFGAELSAVRLHTDQSAAALTEREGARAFAAGRDVYLGRDARSDLHAERNFTTLAHEVAHVLQQTGRPDALGRLAARDLAGSADVDVQREDLVDYVDRFEGYFHADRPEYEQVKVAYAKVPGVAAEIKEIDKIYTINFTWGSENDHNRLVARTKTTAFESLSIDAKAFYVDCLKAVQRYADAAAIFKKLPPDTATVYRSKEMYVELRKDLSWLAPLARTHPFTRLLYPSGVIDAYLHYFYGPVQVIVPPLEEYEKRSFAEGTRMSKQTGPRMDSELSLMTVMAMDRLVLDQRKSLESFGEATTAARPDEEKLRIAEAYATRKPDDPQVGAPATEPELRALYEDLWPELKKRAEMARAYWKRVKTLNDAVFYGFDFETLTAADVKELAKEVGTKPSFAKLEGVLLKVAAALVNADRVPGPSGYRDRVKAQRESLLQHVKPYGAALIELARKTKRNKEDERQMLRLGLVIRLVLSCRERLAVSYDHTTDVKLTKDGHDDERLAARIRIANLLWATGTHFGLSRVVTAADVFLASDKPRLALLSDWIVDPKPVGPVDFQGEETPELTGTGLSNTRIAQFFFADYLNSVAQAIEIALDPAKNPNLSLSAGGNILGEAIKSVKAIDRPQRYLLQKYEYWYDAAGAVTVVKGQKVTDPAKLFHVLVLQHWRTHKLKAALGYPFTAEWYASRRPPAKRQEPLVLWSVPRADRVYTRLMAIPELDKQVQEYLSRNPSYFIAGEEWEAWMRGLIGLAKELREKHAKDKPPKTTIEEISKPLTGALDTDYEKAKQRFYRAARKATALQIRPHLERYRDDERDNAGVPAYVFGLMEQFALATRIDEDQPVQATLLALELANDLSRSFSPKDLYWAYEIVGTLFRYTTGALDVWNDPKFQERVKASKHPGTTDAELENAAATLTKMRGVLGSAMQRVQASRGLRGRVTTGGSTPNTNGVLSTIGLFPTLEAGKSFQMYLREWELVKVHVDFDYLPGFREIEALGVKWPHPAAARAGEPLVIDASSGPAKGTRLPDDTTLLTLRRRTLQPKPRKGSKKPRGAPSPWEDVVITAGDVKDLTRLYHDFGDFSGLVYIGVALGAIEDIVMVGVELAEFIPGVGQGIMVGRFIAAVISFLESDEFAELLEAFKEEGFKAIPNLTKKIADSLSPNAGKLFAWFFFSRPTMIEAPAHATTKIEEQQKKAATGGVWARLARVIRNIARFAKKLLGTVERLRNKAQAPFRAAQSFVLSHPGLAMIVGLMIRYFDALSTLVMNTLFQDEEEKKDTDFVKRLRAAAADGIKGFAERITRAVNVVREIQVPEEIVPLDLVGEFVVDRVISSLGGKYKLLAKGGRAALQRIPGDPWGRIMRTIGETLTGASGVDPNVIYREAIQSHLRGALDGVRTDMFSWLDAVFKDVALLKELGITANFKSDAPTVIDFAGIDFHDGAEAEPSPAEAEHEMPSAGPLHAPSGGERIAAPVRARAEAKLGHDLSHVRLHTGTEGEAVTGRMHADAITSGSHVYLHPTVSPSGGGRGEHVFHHELGHVLQQTGERPLGRSHRDEPSSGRPGRGLTFDAAREAAAERVASRALSPTNVSTPVPVGSPAEGPQPALDRDFVKELLERVRDPQSLQREAVDASAIAQAKAENLLRDDDLNRPVAEQLPAKLIAAIKAMKPGDFQPPFDSVSEKLKAMAVSSDKEAHIKKAIKVLVVSVREGKSPRRIKGETPALPGIWLDPDHFADELARYLYALTGLAFRLSFATKEGPDAIGKRQVIDLNATTVTSARPVITKAAMHVAPFALVQVGHVHLPFLGDTKEAHELWDLLATNSFKNEADFVAEKELWIAATRLAVGHLLPKPGMYLQKTFELSALAKRSVRSQIKGIRPLKAHWPSPGDYAKARSSEVADKTDPIAEHIGLRVGTFGALEKERAALDTPTSPPNVINRDPHHVPQVLLIDYFSNTHKLSAFPEHMNLPFVKDLYPKVTADSSGAVSEIGPIHIKPYTIGTRADALPAILIAVHTHQAEVHVGTEPPDEKSKRVTMGGWVQRRFKESVGDGPWKVMRDRKSLLALKAGSPSTPVTTPVGVNISRDDLGDKIVAGARATYTTMHTEMMNKLKRALHEQEIPYYNLIAASKKSPLADSDKLKTAHVDAAYAAFQGVLGPIMTQSGFKP